MTFFPDTDPASGLEEIGFANRAFISEVLDTGDLRLGGIGNALAHANQAVLGDITGVTDNLGIAFNSTFTALVITIVVMFMIHQLQSMQEKLVLDTRRYCDDWFVRRLKV